jgi:hypothetical protein
MTVIIRNSFLTLCFLLLVSTFSLSHQPTIHHAKAFVDENIQITIDLHVKEDHKNSKFLASLGSLIILNSGILFIILLLRRFTLNYQFSPLFLLAVFYQSSYFRKASFTP